VRFLKALALVFGVSIVALAALLLEAHYEIRSLRPELPTIEAVQALRGVRPEDPVSLHFVNTASQTNPAGRTIGHPAFLLHWGDARGFLIDTGMEREDALAFGELGELVFDGDPIEPMGSPAEQLGPALKTVEGLGFTHLHSDHTGGAPGLCEFVPRLRVVQTGDQAARGNYTTAPGRGDLEGIRCAEFEELEGEGILEVPGFPGLFAIAAGGHTPGSTIFVASVQGQLWIFSGDVTNLRAELLENRPKPALYSLFITPEDREGLERLRTWLSALDALPDTTVVVSHDVDSLPELGVPEWPPKPDWGR